MGYPITQEDIDMISSIKFTKQSMFSSLLFMIFSYSFIFYFFLK